MVKSYRIIRASFANSPDPAFGARTYGGRWNSKGTSVIYTSSTLSLAVLELLAATASSGNQSLAEAYVYWEFTFDDSMIHTAGRAALKPGWNAFPYKPFTQHYGDAWVQKSAGPILRVPSVHIPKHEYHYILNPNHPQFSRLKKSRPQKISLDHRL